MVIRGIVHEEEIHKDVIGAVMVHDHVSKWYVCDASVVFGTLIN